MNEIHAMLQRMSELAIDAANGTKSDADREMLDAEVKQLKEEITRIESNKLEYIAAYIYAKGIEFTTLINLTPGFLINEALKSRSKPR